MLGLQHIWGKQNLEHFEIFNEAGERMGLMPRNEVHKIGAWHRAVHVFVFDTQGRLLLQRRSEDKDLYPGFWDYSVGEHLQPGESYLDGAVRGLAEELHLFDVDGEVDLEVVGTEHRMVQNGAGFVDREMLQAYRYDISHDHIDFDPVEVAEIRFATLGSIEQQLQEDIKRGKNRFTPWFIKSMRMFGYLAN